MGNELNFTPVAPVEKVPQASNFDCSVACLRMLAQATPTLDVDNLLSHLPFQIGAPMPPEGLRYAPTGIELQYLLMRRGGLRINRLETESYLRFMLADAEAWNMESRRCFTQRELELEAAGRLALLTVKSRNDPEGYHMIFWDGEKILDPDPQVSEPQNWNEYTVLEVMLVE